VKVTIAESLSRAEVTASIAAEASARSTADSTHAGLATAHGLTANISAGLAGAASPGAGNVFATMADAGGLDQKVLSWIARNQATRVRYGGVDQSTFAADATLSGAATGRTLISGVVSERIRQAGYIRQVYVQVQNNADAIKFKVFRPNGSNYDFVGESELIKPVYTGKQIIALATPIACHAGDILGVYLAAVNAQIGCKTATGANSIRYLDTDVTGSNVDFTSTVTDFSMCIDGYGIAPYLTVSGDSIAEGHHTANNWHSFYDNGPAGLATSEIMHQLSALVSAPLEYQNHAMGGQGMDWVFSIGMVSAVTTQASIYLIHSGVNNIISGQAWSYVEACYDAALALVPAGAKLFVDEILPWTNGTDGNAATVRSWNASLAAWCITNSVTLIACHDAMGQIRGSTGQLDDLASAYDYDGVHLTQTGVNKMAAIWYAALRA
jgi:hypothetical protein